jgi:hypothetical protein
MNSANLQYSFKLYDFQLRKQCGFDARPNVDATMLRRQRQRSATGGCCPLTQRKLSFSSISAAIRLLNPDENLRSYPNMRRYRWRRKTRADTQTAARSKVKTPARVCACPSAYNPVVEAVYRSLQTPRTAIARIDLLASKSRLHLLA